MHHVVASVYMDQFVWGGSGVRRPGMVWADQGKVADWTCLSCCECVTRRILCHFLDLTYSTMFGQWRVSLALWCHAGLIFSKTWVENQWWTPAVSKTSVSTDSPEDITNWNQPLLLFHMDPTNTIVWARKSFIGPLVSCRVDFQHNLAWKSVMISDGPQQSAKLLWPLTAQGT
jgi:hypothetical protein